LRSWHAPVVVCEDRACERQIGDQAAEFLKLGSLAGDARLELGDRLPQACLGFRFLRRFRADRW